MDKRKGSKWRRKNISVSMECLCEHIPHTHLQTTTQSHSIQSFPSSQTQMKGQILSHTNKKAGNAWSLNASHGIKRQKRLREREVTLRLAHKREMRRQMQWERKCQKRIHTYTHATERQALRHASTAQTSQVKI